jgi:hypothetical protein
MSRGPWTFGELHKGEPERIDIFSEPWGEGHGWRKVASARVKDAPFVCMAPDMCSLIFSIAKMNRREMVESVQIKDQVDDMLRKIAEIDQQLNIPPRKDSK